MLFKLMFSSEVMRGWYYPWEMEPHQVLFGNHHRWNIKNKHFSLMCSITVEVCVYNYNINCNSTEIWSHFSTVFVFFLLKNAIVPRTSYVKVLWVRTKFLPVIGNRTEVVVHPALLFDVLHNSKQFPSITTYFHLPFRLGSYLAFWTAGKTLFFFLWGLQIAEHRTPGLLKLSSR